MIKGVIFDMDGVIIDSEPLHYKVFMQYASVLGISMTSEEYDTFIGTTNEYIFGFLKEKYHLTQAVPDLVQDYDAKIKQYLLASKNSLAPIEGVDDLIKQCYGRDLQLAVASSSAKDRIDLVIDMFGLAPYFTAKISGQQVERSKPAPDIFLLAAATIGLLPEECVVIEDSHNGVTAAKAAGMKCIGYVNPNSGKQDISHADRVIRHFSELNKQIEMVLSM